MEIPSDQRRTTSIETPNLGPNADIESGVLRANGKRKGSRRRPDETAGNIAGRGAGFALPYVVNALPMSTAATGYRSMAGAGR
jgi:hypothetical protein